MTALIAEVAVILLGGVGAVAARLRIDRDTVRAEKDRLAAHARALDAQLARALRNGDYLARRLLQLDGLLAAQRKETAAAQAWGTDNLRRAWAAEDTLEIAAAKENLPGSWKRKTGETPDTTPTAVHDNVVPLRVAR